MTPTPEPDTLTFTMSSNFTSIVTTIAIASVFLTVILWFVEKILIAIQTKDDNFIRGVLVALQVSLIVVVLPILWIALLIVLSL